VFALTEEAEGFMVSVDIHQRKVPVSPLRIIHSDSEYELLVLIQISHSYVLNVAAEEALVLQNSIWVGNGGVIGWR